MAQIGKYLLIGSSEPFSGKSTTILGLSHQLQQKGIDIAFGKPLVINSELIRTGVEQDVNFISDSLNLPANRIAATILGLDETIVQKRLLGEITVDYQQSLRQKYLESSWGDLFLIEGAENLEEGSLFGLSVSQIAEAIDGKVLLVNRYKSTLSAEQIILAKQKLGDRLVGVVINDISQDQVNNVDEMLVPYLEAEGIPVLGVLPKTKLLRCISVHELVNNLEAQVLCSANSLDFMVESMAIGAMNVNSAVKYFRKRRNMAVVTGGDRVDIQQAALESSAQCLILTGKLPPASFILSRAEELEVPILSVDLDTLTTVEIIDKTFRQAKVHEPVKVQCIQSLMAEHFDVNRLLSLIGLIDTPRPPLG
ncbi:MAG: phosphotransacetylase family protein [Cyanobacteria bacterium P01_A01_bin.45]